MSVNLKALIVLFFSISVAGFSVAQVELRAEPKFIGTLDISGRYSEFGEWAESNLYRDAPIQAYQFSGSRPSTDEQNNNPQFRELVPTDFELIETSYEYKQVVVSSRYADWVQVRIKGELGWIRMEPGEEFSPYLDLVDGLWGYTVSKTVNIAQVPGGETRPIEITAEMQNVENPHQHWSTFVDIIETRSLSDIAGEDDWIKIQVYNQQSCKRYDKPYEVVFEGWIPAYDSDGEITVWYHSRGC